MNNDGMTLLPGQINTSSSNEAGYSEENLSRMLQEKLFSLSDDSNYEYNTDDCDTDKYDTDESDKDSELERVKRRLTTYMDMLATREAQEGQHHGKEFEKLTDVNLQLQRLKRAFEAAMDEEKIGGFVYGFYLPDGSVIQGSSQNLSEWWEENIPAYGPDATGQQTENLLLDPTGQAMMPEVSIDGSGGNFKLPTIELCDQKEQIGVNRNAAGQFTTETSPNAALAAPNFPVITMVQGSRLNTTVPSLYISTCPAPNSYVRQQEAYQQGKHSGSSV